MAELTGGRPAVSVVVPTCGNAAGVQRVLGSVAATPYEPLEVMVVENRPPAAGTRAVVEQEPWPMPVRYVEEPWRGSSAARNAGIAAARGEILALTDDDVLVDPAWIPRAVEIFEQDADVACVAGRILPLALETRSQRLFDQFAVFDKGPERRVFRLWETRAVEPLFPYIPGHIGSGANIFVRRDVAVGMGGFDPVLGAGTPTTGGEDLDLFIRLAQDGHAIVYDPMVVVLHDHPGELASLRRHAYNYGLGLTALLAKQLVHGPRRLDLLRAIPAGVRYGLDPNSRKNAAKSSDYPRSLELLERFGMVLGPVAYVVSAAGSAARGLAGGHR